MQQYHLFVQTGTWPGPLAAVAAGVELDTPAATFNMADVMMCMPGQWLNDEHINFGMWWLQQ